MTPPRPCQSSHVPPWPTHRPTNCGGYQLWKSAKRGRGKLTGCHLAQNVKWIVNGHLNETSSRLTRNSSQKTHEHSIQRLVGNVLKDLPRSLALLSCIVVFATTNWTWKATNPDSQLAPEAWCVGWIQFCLTYLT